MNKILYIIFLSIIVSNCTFKPVVKHHGVPFLEKKQASLIVNKSNKNDVMELLGYPSTKSKFDNDLWIYIERKQTQSSVRNLGKMKIFKNDVLVLEMDKFGILIGISLIIEQKYKIADVASNLDIRANIFGS